MNDKVLKPVLLAGAAAICLWGVYGALSRPAKTPAGASPAKAAAEIPAAEWGQTIPELPCAGLRPSGSAVPAGAAPSGAGLMRVLSLPDGAALRLELSGSAYQIGADNTRYRLNSINVWQDDTKLQTIEFTAPYFQQGEAGGSLETEKPDFGFATGDWNFDGLPDFTVANSLSGEEAARTADYAFHFVWSPERGCFMPSPELDRLPSPRFDEENRLIECSYSGEALSGREVYRWEGGSLWGAEKQERFLDRESRLLTTTDYEWTEDGFTALSSTESPAKREISRVVPLSEGNRRIILRLSAELFLQGADPGAGWEGEGFEILVNRADGSPEGAFIQRIQCPLQKAGYALEDIVFDVDFPDWNFDGCPDLRVRTGREDFQCYLWDAGPGQFELFTQLEGYGEPRPDPVTREICVRDAGDGGCTETYFRWEGAAPVPLRQVRTLYGGWRDAVYMPEDSVTLVYQNGGWEGE